MTGGETKNARIVDRLGQREKTSERETEKTDTENLEQL